ncbi:unnamed protein product [Aureobasidium mustum]|uniref:Knr4/Smi1-like domain-containing protein n=1 Tax=Aureobasidium mustum TaxID=2773714 RepID=A0A9N8P839_9PEZI|nr:unnamed protein product [Aureobasidium mustum]
MTPSPHLLVEPAYILTMPHLPEVERCIVGLALRFALLGRVDAARQFVELTCSRPMVQNYSSPDLRALVVHWRLTYFPANIPEELKTDAYFDDYMKSKDQEISRWPHYVQPENRTEDETGLRLMLEPGQNNSSYSGRKPELGPALQLAVKLAEARNVDPLNDPKVNEILEALPGPLNHNQLQDAFLVGSPRCAPIFMSGALAKKLGLSDQELDSRAAELLGASQQRYWHGPSSMGPETISELLQSCNHDTLARSDSHWKEMEEDKPTSLYNSPASEKQITDLEQKLDATLPEDFKAFLRISNGFGGIWNGCFPGPYLRSTDEIDWLDYDEWELEFDQLTLPSLECYKIVNDAEFPDQPIFTDVVRIASQEIDDIWLIPPGMMQYMREYYKEIYEVVNDDGKRIIDRSINDFAGSWDEWNKLDWGCVYWASGTVIQLESFKSFKAWLENAAWNAKNAGREGDEDA